MDACRKMKEFLKKYFLWLLVAVALVIAHNTLKSFYISAGRGQVEKEYNERTALQKIEYQKQFKIKDDLLANAVREKYEEREKHNKESQQKNTEFSKYKDRIKLEFVEINLRLSKTRGENKFLKEEISILKTLNFSLASINKNLLWDWEASDETMFKNFDTVLKESNAATEQKYIDFINKIDRIRKGRK
jgi:hypothetical protein